MAKKDPITRKTLDQAVEAILKGLDKMVGELNGEMNLRFKAVDARFDKVDDRLDDLKSGQRFVKNDIKRLNSRIAVL